MQIGTLIKMKNTTEIGIVIEKAKTGHRNARESWIVLGLTKNIGFRYELSFPNKHVEIL